jgi:riboflavin biosynthesis pyrimidine reductase
MQQLLPEAQPNLSDADLDELYGWPNWPSPQPWVRANMVSTIDGAAASPDGLSEGISSPADRRVFGRLRGLADAVLVGAGTVRSEGYRPARVKSDFADRRAAAGQSIAPAIAVVSRSLDLDLSLPLYAEPAVRTIVVTCAAADPTLINAAREICDVEVCGDESVDLRAAVAALHHRGLSRIHSEGGPRLLADLIAAEVLDELLLTLSPTVAGGSFPTGVNVPRILEGTSNPSGLRAVRLHHLLEEDSMLFASYRFRPLPEQNL